jgi:mono/diheme cytochrome c family protein
MRVAFRFLGRLVGVLALAAAAALGFLLLRRPALRPAPTERVERTPERIARGRYLGVNVTGCLDCHSDHLWDQFGSPIKPGTEGQGGFPFEEKFGVPGLVVAQNLTSDPATGLGAWTDGEIERAIREGVDRSGRALFPMMPYKYFHAMSDEDVRAVVAWLRTLPPVRRETPQPRLDFPVNLLVRLEPKPIDSRVETPTDHLLYGRYLAGLAGCRECHTPHDAHGQRLRGQDFAGGWVLKGPWGTVVSSNLSPASGTWMSQASKEDFIGRMQSMGASGHTHAEPGRNTIMPWESFAGMTREDLGALYDFLKTVRAIGAPVDSFPEAARASDGSAR